MSLLNKIKRHYQKFNLNDIIKICDLSKNPTEYIKKVDSKILHNKEYYINKVTTIDLLKKAKAPKSKELLNEIINIKQNNSVVENILNDIQQNNSITENILEIIPEQDNSVVENILGLDTNNQISLIDFNNNLLKYNDKQIKYFYYTDNIYFKAKDIAILLDYVDTDDAIRKHIDKNNKFNINNFNIDSIISNFDINKQHPNTIFINTNGLKKLLCKSNKIISNEILNIFNMKEDTRYLRKELEIIKFIQLYLDELNIKYIFQYSINNYKIDLYLPDNNIAIEIDEFNHINRCKIYELNRESYIKIKLNCKFIRINPDDKQFEMAKCIALITKHIFI